MIIESAYNLIAYNSRLQKKASLQKLDAEAQIIPGATVAKNNSYQRLKFGQEYIKRHIRRHDYVRDIRFSKKI